MAVHVGTAEERQGDYFGPTLDAEVERYAAEAASEPVP
jgi:hypothetical protein